jgi:hypothetical protein
MAQLAQLPTTNTPVVYDRSGGGVENQLISALIASIIPQAVKGMGRGLGAAFDQQDAGAQVPGGQAPSILGRMFGAPSVEELAQKDQQEQLFNARLEELLAGTEKNRADTDLTKFKLKAEQDAKAEYEKLINSDSQTAPTEPVKTLEPAEDSNFWERISAPFTTATESSPESSTTAPKVSDAIKNMVYGTC